MSTYGKPQVTVVDCWAVVFVFENGPCEDNCICLKKKGMQVAGTADFKY